MGLIRPTSRKDVVGLLAKSNNHMMMTFPKWHQVHNNPTFVRVYKDSLRELAGDAIDLGFEVVVEEGADGEFRWACAGRVR